MNVFTLVFQHAHFPAVKIVIDVRSKLTLAQVTEDATLVIESADDFIEGAELDMRNFSLVKIACRGYTVVTFEG